MFCCISLLPWLPVLTTVIHLCSPRTVWPLLCTHTNIHTAPSWPSLPFRYNSPDLRPTAIEQELIRNWLSKRWMQYLYGSAGRRVQVDLWTPLLSKTSRPAVILPVTDMLKCMSVKRRHHAEQIFHGWITPKKEISVLPVSPPYIKKQSCFFICSYWFFLSVADLSIHVSLFQL